MPRVPTYDAPQVQARSIGAPQLAYQSANVPAAAFDNGAAAIGQGGRMLDAIADKQVEEETAAAASEALTAWQSRKRQMLFHDDGAFYRKSGKDAVDGYAGLAESMEAERAKFAESLSPNARKLFDARSQADLNGELEGASRYVMREREVWLDGTAVAEAANRQTEAATYWNDPARREASLTAGRNALLERAAQKGWNYDDPRLKHQLQNYESEGLASVIQRMATESPMEAKRLFDEKAGFLLPQHFGSVQRVVEHEAKRYMVQAEYDKISRTVRPDYAPQSDDYLAHVTASIVQVESGGNANAVNERSSAAGAGQFTNATWIETIRKTRPDIAAGKTDEQILALRFDSTLSSEMTTAYAKENAARLQQANVPATPGNLYLAHFLGPGGALKVLGAKPDAPVEELLDERAVASNPTILRGKTAAEVRVWAQAKMDKALNPSPSDIYRAKVERAESITDPEIRQNVLQMAKADYAAQKEAVEQRKKEAEEQAWSAVRQGVDPMRLPPDVQDALGPAHMKTLMEFRAKGGKVKTDFAYYDRVMSEPVDDLRKRSVIELESRLEEGELKEVLKRKRGEGDARGPASLEQQLDSMMAQLGLTGSSNAEKRGRLQRIVRSTIGDMEATSGKPLDFAERQKVLDRLTIDVVKPGYLWDSKTKVANITSLSDIPRDERDAIKQMMPNATEQQMVDAYTSFMLGQK